MASCVWRAYGGASLGGDFRRECFGCLVCTPMDGQDAAYCAGMLRPGWEETFGVRLLAA